MCFLIQFRDYWKFQPWNYQRLRDKLLSSKHVWNHIQMYWQSQMKVRTMVREDRVSLALFWALREFPAARWAAVFVASIRCWSCSPIELFAIAFTIVNGNAEKSTTPANYFPTASAQSILTTLQRDARHLCLFLERMFVISSVLICTHL